MSGPMRTALGCIADDFTGATDLAGILARGGARVSLRIGVPPHPPTDPAPFEVIALKIRSSPPDQAVAEARAARDWLQAAGAARLFWKYCSTFDSTPQGNIGPVAEALMADLGAAQTIYCPAFPQNGRSVYMGTLFVDRQPLAESPMRDHPLTPMRDSNLMRLLAPQVRRPVGLIDHRVVACGVEALRVAIADLAAEGVAHLITDAITDADLAAIARACCDMPLITGGSAIAMALPAIYRDRGLIAGGGTGAAPPPPASAGTVILSGSCSAMTNRQLADYRGRGRPSYRLDPLEIARHGAGPAIDWLRDQDLSRAPVIHATEAPDRVRAVQAQLGAGQAGRIVEDALADCAIAARDAGARRLIVAGGETSGAVTRALGVDRLDIGAEIAPGVPWTFCRSGGQAMALALKSGNFGTETFFTDAQTALDRT